MILNCEMCGTRYLVDSSDIGALGRHVRCAECGHEWFATTDGQGAGHHAVPPAMKAEPVPTPEQARAVEEQAASAAEDAGIIRNLPAVVPQRDYKTPAFVLGGGAVVLVALLATVILAKAAIVQAWPAAVHAYRVVGLMPPEVRQVAQPAPRLMLFGLRITRATDRVSLQGRIENVGPGVAEGAALSVYEYDVEDTLLGRTDLPLADQINAVQPGQGTDFEIEFTLQNAVADKLRIEVVPVSEQN